MLVVIVGLGTPAMTVSAQCSTVFTDVDVCPGQPGSTVNIHWTRCGDQVVAGCVPMSSTESTVTCMTPAPCNPSLVGCSSPCTGAPDGCDGQDTSGDGQTDEGCGGGDCSNYRTDPVHVGSGGFLTEPTVHVQFAGSTVPIRFVQQHVSLDGWSAPLTRSPDLEPTRLAGGWFHSFDERLFSSALGSSDVPAVTFPGAAFVVVHRQASVVSRRFSCPSRTSTPADFTCTTVDGSLDRLIYVQATSTWRIEGAAEVATFAAGGRLDGRRSYDSLESWTVYYHSSGTYTGRIDYVEDHLGRRLIFVWVAMPGGQEVLDELRDASGTTLVEFGYDTFGHRLTSTRSALGTEQYAYAVGTGGGTSPILTSVQRDGVDTVSVTYQWPDGTHPYAGGRVRTIAALDGSFAFRYPGEANNLCDTMGFDETRTSMIIDRSSPEPTSSCASDAACAAGEACEAGQCRVFTCQQYLDTGGGIIDYSRPDGISGDCPCGADAAQVAYTSPTTDAPRRISLRVAQDGARTSYAYDTHGRLIGRCENDDATGSVFDGTLATCRDSDGPAGAFTAYTYRAFGTSPVIETTLVATQTHRSRFSGMLVTTTYTYDSTSRRMTSRAVEGYTYNSSGSAALETQTTNYAYTSGKLTSVTGPASGQRTDYTYHSSGSGLDTGLVQYERRFWGTGASDYLQTAYSSYTRLGRPQTITSPASVATTTVYSFGGMRADSRTVAGQTTSYTYTTGGRLATTVEPTGRRIDVTYGPFGRPSSVDLRDTSGATTFDRVALAYDTAGRRTSVATQRYVSGSLWWTASSSSATYENHGLVATETRGPQSPTEMFYDSNGMGELTQLVRGDGDTVDIPESGYDAFGREGSLIRNFTGSTSGTHAYTYRNGTTVPEVGESLPVTVTDPNSQVRTYTWDDFGQLVQSVSAEWGTMRYYYVQGRLTQRFEPDGRRADYTYDSMGRITQIDNDAANPTLVGQDYRFYYDNTSGGVTCPTGSPYTCSYRRGRLGRVQVEYAAATFYDMLYDYASDGQLGVETWPGGGKTIYTYDASGRMTRMQHPTTTTDSLRYTYDTVSGNTLDQTDVTTITGDLWNGSSWASYVVWGSAMDHDAAGRLTSVTTADAFSTSYPHLFTYRTDGRLSTLRARRRSGSGAVDMINRTYAYAVDGSSTGFSGTATGDVARTFRYDAGNRLLCTTSASGSSTCPASGSPLISSYVYNASDTRTTLVDFVSPTTTTRSYTLLGNSLSTETWTGHTVTFGHPAYAPNGGRRTTDEDSAYANDTRTYGYDGEGRLRTVTLPRATGSGTPDTYVATILYDHRSRPFMVTLLNTAWGVYGTTRYFYDAQDRLIGRMLMPSSLAPTSTTTEMIQQVDPLLTGTQRLEYVNGSLTSESFYYTANAPEGAPLATFSFTRGGTTSTEAWRPDWGGFGELRSATGSMVSPPPWRFAGQLALAGSEAIVWTGSALLQARGPLSLNRWRVYDPRVGQYLQPEPLLLSGMRTLSHPYAYAYVDPADFVDPTGRDGNILGGVVEQTSEGGGTDEDQNATGANECGGAGGGGISERAGGGPDEGPRPRGGVECGDLCRTSCLYPIFESPYMCFRRCMRECLGGWPPNPH
jgi:RHS repeat-associated protein